MSRSSSVPKIRPLPRGAWFAGCQLVCLLASAFSAGQELSPDTDAAYAKRLALLADKCQELGLEEQARFTREWFFERSPDRLYLFPLREQKAVDEAASPLVMKWRARFQQYRSERAESLFAQAREGVGTRSVASTYQLLHEALRENPDHAGARLALGFRKANGKWIPAPTPTRQRRGTSLQPDYRWKRGSYWQIQSPHFRILTNHSPQEGLRLAALLEDVHAVWRQLFVRCWTTRTAIEAAFDGQARPPRFPKHKVVLFRDRAEYVRQLTPMEPQIAISRGYYSKSRETSFFYAGEGLDRTWVHEATHQLFQEIGNAVPSAGEKWNFWLLEGIAVYMESLNRFDQYCTVGGIEAHRLQFARLRRFNGEFYMPVGELVRLGRVEVQQHPEIRRIYTQAAGLTHYLMHAQQGRDREALVSLLAAVYLGRDRPESLSGLLERPFTDIDESYPDFLQVNDQQLAAIAPERTTSLALGRTAVSDTGLPQISNCRNLDWLDLSHTRVSSAGIKQLRGLSHLRHLGLEQTQVDDTIGDVLASLPSLEILDLSGTNITDDIVEKLAELPDLKLLWLNETRISDRSMSVLEKMENLETLGLAGTQLSPQNIDRLERE